MTPAILKEETFKGWELVHNTARLCAMNLMLHAIGSDKDAEKLFKQFDDGMATWMYSRALLDFRKLGDSPKADASLKAALAENKFVPFYLLGRRKMPRNLPDRYGFGDDTEADAFICPECGLEAGTVQSAADVQRA